MNYLKAFAIVFAAGVAAGAVLQQLLKRATRHERRAG
jgi:hypothetical protein